MAKKPQKKGLSQYGQPSPALKPRPARVGALPLKPKETFASLDFLWHEFLTSGLLWCLYTEVKYTIGGRWSKIRALEKFIAKT
jgi:hypothetical protein